MRVLGSKSKAKQLALARGVPCLPGYQGDDQSQERLVAEHAKRIAIVRDRNFSLGVNMLMGLVRQDATVDELVDVLAGLHGLHSLRDAAGAPLGRLTALVTTPPVTRTVTVAPPSSNPPVAAFTGRFAAFRAACGEAHMKAILATGELARLDTVISRLKLDFAVSADEVAADPEAGPNARACARHAGRTRSSRRFCF